MQSVMPNWFDAAYTVIGALIAAGVYARAGLDAAFWTAFLMVLCYCAGGVKYRHR